MRRVQVGLREALGRARDSGPGIQLAGEELPCETWSCALALPGELGFRLLGSELCLQGDLKLHGVGFC